MLVKEFVLFAVMLIEEQMQLGERVPRNLPVVLFVHVAQRHRIGEKLIQVFRTRSADLFVQGDRHSGDLTKWLNFGGALVLKRSCSFAAGFELVIRVIAFAVFRTHGFSSDGNGAERFHRSLENAPRNCSEARQELTAL